MTKPEQQPRSRGAERAKQARAQSDQESVQPGPLCKGTNKTAEELAEMFGLEPDGSPRTEAAPDGPACPPLSPGDGPFNTETIFPGCNTPLTQECVDWANEKYGYAADRK